MKILLLGRNGQLGWELQRALATLGELTALDRKAPAPLCGDLSDLDGLAATVQRLRPAIIVNAAAYTAVDRAESEPDAARRVNAEAPAVLAQAAAEAGAWLVHYSTDYVFDGTGSGAWREDDPTAPLGVYGATKLAGEAAIRASGCRHLVFRTSWVYGTRGGNFAKTMLRLAGERESLNVVADQVGAPTGADLLADITHVALRRAMADPSLSGTYHAAPAGETSWHGYARHVLAHAQALGWSLRTRPESVAPISSADYPTPARRPLNSRLDTTRLRQTFGLHLPDWRTGVERLVTELTPGA